MPEPDHSRTRHATVEDWDEEDEASLLHSRHIVHASSKRPDHIVLSERKHGKPSKEGRDSGYVSQAATVIGEPQPANPKYSALPIERERQPYHITRESSSKPLPRQQTSAKAKDTISEPQPERPSAKVRHVHPLGKCRLCDYFGWHDESKIEILPASTMPYTQPASPKTARKTAVKALPEAESSAATKIRPSSSIRGPPPPLTLFTSFVAPPPHQQPIYSHPPFPPPSDWATPVLPPLHYPPLPYPFVSPDPASATVHYPAYQPQGPFFDQFVPEPRSARPSRRPSPQGRQSSYGQPLIRYESHEHEAKFLEGPPSREHRVNGPSHQSRQSFEVESLAMLPPAKTQSINTPFAQKPRNKRAQTYHPEESLPRLRSSRGHDRYEEEDDYRDHRAPIPNRGRRESPSRPPTSYKAPTNLESRPTLSKKAVSYSTPETVSRVASSQRLAHRSNTLSSIPLEQQEANAEAYQRNKNRDSANAHLTAEALNSLNKGTSSSRSETTSSYSHMSHQSSKDSSRGLSHASTSATQFTVPVGSNVIISSNYGAEGRPIIFTIDDRTVSVAPSGRESDKIREHRRIERAPSVTSKTSKVSMASSNDPHKRARRASQLEDVAGISRQNSRNSSTPRPPYEYSYTTRRQSVDLSGTLEDLELNA